MGADIFSQMPKTSVDMLLSDDGSFIIQSKTPLDSYERCAGDWLETWAEKRPDQVVLAERQGEGWRTLTYRQCRDQVHNIAQGMINLGLVGKGPLVILSGNSVDHALMMMAAMHIGIPVTSISVAYSLVAKTYEQLHGTIKRLRPCAVYADNEAAFAPAIQGCEQISLFITSQKSDVDSDAITFQSLIETLATEAVSALFQTLDGDTHAKYMLTSGSTGKPKIAVVTQRMICSNQQMIAQYYPFIEQETPRILDWLPWSHTFGSNHNFNLVLRNGGSLYIDNGKPVPNLIGETLKNIKEIKPNLYFNVPKGYEVLVEHLQQDEELKKTFFSNINMLFYAAAALAPSVWDDLKRMAEEVGHDVFFTTEWGATETAPAITNVHWRLDKPGNIGVPFPGVQIRFVPNGSKLEMRIKGPIVFEQYLNDPEATTAAFDELGFYCIGDAGKLKNRENPSEGILFDGRVSEDFKLSTGTWVCVASIRSRMYQNFGDLVSDGVVVGHNQDYISLMVIPGPKMRQLAGDTEGRMSGHELFAVADVRAALQTSLEQMSSSAKGSSQKVCKLLVLDELPHLELGEITDKGSLNQRKMLENRSDSVDEIYKKSSSELVLSII
ncbi:feruloyl-CoA synthase [Amphritea atlantica]|uniref:Feruloyl-CoA synthase n=1 Tax=Amphritea atlantica TaxID=355243 RepID=A0A1H9KEJ9_9GAMM|nr:feruloyl-CoA synthase [Amphritea atlantica]SEQ97541.1 feruloyl-CoA synthase [Amphritea atlantica]